MWRRFDRGAAMSEWWTYRPKSFLLFSERTYHRLFELYNAEIWPAHVLAIGAGLVLWLALLQRRAWAPRAACAVLAAAHLWVAWAFHWQHFASINWAATWYGAAFAIEAIVLLACAWLGAGGPMAAPVGRTRNVGLALLLFALVAQPALGALAGRPWQQAEVFGLAPDPTVLGTLGVLLLVSPRRAAAAHSRRAALTWLSWLVPLLWCAVTGATLATMHAADAPLMPAAALLALAATAWSVRA
jgi:hypothetical protein